MRLVVLSDIHGNRVAFEAVLAELATLLIDRVVCLGDVAALRAAIFASAMPHADVWAADWF